MQRHPVHTKMQCNLICQPTKLAAQKESHESVHQKLFPQKDELCDLTDTYSAMKCYAETRSELLNPTPNNPRSLNDILRQNPKPKCNDDYRCYFLSCTSVFHGTHTLTFQNFQERVTEPKRSNSKSFFSTRLWMLFGDWVTYYSVLHSSQTLPLKQDSALFFLHRPDSFYSVVSDHLTKILW